LAPVGEHHPLMDTACQRDRKDALECPDKNRDRLSRMSRDVLRFGVGIGFLMQAFHARDFPP